MRSPDLAALARPQPHQERGRDEERRRVDREREAGPDAEHERGRQRRAEELGDRLDVPNAAFAGWISSSGTVCGTRPVYAGRKNASAVPKPASISAIARSRRCR